MKPLKVLQLGTSGPLYGAERWILALSRHLDPALIESHIAVIVDEPDKPVPLLEEAARMGMRCHSIAAPGRFNPQAITALRQLIRDEGIHIIHSHGYKADIITLLAVRGTEARTVATPHGWSRDAGLTLQFYEWLDRQSFRFFDAVAPLSPELARGLQRSKTVAAKLQLIPNGVDLSEIEQAGPVPAELVALRKNGPVIGYVGQLNARKDLSTLLHAFSQWGRSDASLVLVGDGDESASLKALAQSLGIESQTHFCGFRPDRLEWMRGFDAFVLPSREEGIPRCLMEAMALGVPVIASDIPGNRDLVAHGETGQIFPVGDTNLLKDGIDAVMHPKFDRASVQRAKELIDTRHSARSMAQGYERLFQSLAN